VGKLFWGTPFKIGFYGLPASAEPARPVRASTLRRAA
jgi:hypothetical protein